MKKIFLHIFILFLSVLSFLISLYPILNTGTKASIFNFEPDVPYIANAINYIYTDDIVYSAHPATPSIVLLSYSVIPLRIYSKLVDKVPFFTWTIRNQDFLYTYERYFISLVFALSVYLFLYSIYKYSASFVGIVAGWIALFAYNNTPYLGIIVQSEPLSFLIVSIWLYVFISFIKKQSLKTYLVLCLLSGIALANKLPNMFFVFASISLFIFLKGKSYQAKIKNALLGVLTASTSFFVFTWPIRTQYSALWAWIKHLFTHSGVHGRGGEEVFNLYSQFYNLQTLFSIERYATIVMAVCIYLIAIYHKDINKKIINPVTVFLGWMVLGILILSKFPLSHYHQFHYIGIIFFGAYVVSKTKAYFYIPVFLILLNVSFKLVTQYWSINVNEVKNFMTLEEYVKDNPSKIATVWEWGRSSDYSLLHTRDWICTPYGSYLNEERPNLLSMTTDMEDIVLKCGVKDKVFSVCWDKMYIQGSELPKFINKYKNMKLSSKAIEGTKDMWLVTSDHCIK